MAKTSRKRRTAAPEPDTQAPPGTWTPDELIAAVRRPSAERKLELLREAGILDASGKLAQKYRSWGTRVSRTET